MITMQEWWARLRFAGAVWQHSGDARAPHVVLRSGKHSDGFIDTLRYLSGVGNLLTAADELSDLLRKSVRPEYPRIVWVFGSPMAGIPLAVAVAQSIRAERVAFTEKKGDKELICRYDVAPGETVLLIEEMTTTGQTPQRAADAILARNPEANILPWVGAFLRRCPSTTPELHDREIVSLVGLPELEIRFNEWYKASCPLCIAGSRAIENCKRVWPDLLATMRNPDHLVPE